MAKPILLNKSHFLFGLVEPKPKIHGHRVNVSRDCWVTARYNDTREQFYVEDLGGDWRLRPVYKRKGVCIKIIPKCL